MAFTSADLTKVEAAILALAQGTRKVSLMMGDKSISYGQTDIGALQDLRSSILAEVSTTATRPKFVLTQTSKGL